MSKTKYVIGGIAAFVGLAYFTQPSEGDFKLEVDRVIEAERSQAIDKGEYGTAFVNFLASNFVEGEYDSGLLSSSYDVKIAGTVIAECTGMFGMVTCSEVKQ